MKVDILASGSSGNCIAVRSGQTTILVDAGEPKTLIEKRLLKVGIRADEIAAIFITHAHKDHICGLPLANKYKIPIYAGEEEWKLIKNVDDDLKRISKSRFAVGIGFEFEVFAFNTSHGPNSYEPLGYTIFEFETGEKCSVCIDTGHVDDEMLRAMRESNIYIIEANHEPNMVEVSDYPNSVKARVLSHIGHLSNEQTAEALKQLIKGKGERIYLTHLSSKNNLPALAEMTVKRALKQNGFVAGKDYEIEVV